MTKAILNRSQTINGYHHDRGTELEIIVYHGKFRTVKSNLTVGVINASDLEAHNKGYCLSCCK